MGDFLTQYMKIMKDLAEAADEDKRVEESKIRDTVNDMIALFEEEDRTCYQLALLGIQITWWADLETYCENPEGYAEQVPALCQEIRSAEPDCSHDSPLAEVLEHLEMEADEALDYSKKMADRIHRRSRAGKWNDSYLHRDVPRSRVVPRSRRAILEQREQRRERLQRMNIDEDIEGSVIAEDDLQESEGDDGMETDDCGCDSEDELEYDGSEGATNVSSSTNSDHKMTLISNSDEVVAEISDLESSVYIKAFIQYWNDDPAAWRKQIDTWEQTHGIPGRSILHCLKREDGEELRDMGDIPFRMSARGGQAAPKGHGN